LFYEFSLYIELTKKHFFLRRIFRAFSVLFIHVLYIHSHRDPMPTCSYTSETISTIPMISECIRLKNNTSFKKSRISICRKTVFISYAPESRLWQPESGAAPVLRDVACPDDCARRARTKNEKPVHRSVLHATENENGLRVYSCCIRRVYRLRLRKLNIDNKQRH